MRVLAHLSDLHFGRTDPQIVAGLLNALAKLGPDLIIISGDFTQRAKVSEFEEARAFLAKLPAPYLGVPGNHDIPLYDIYRRFYKPLDRYRRYISETTEPTYSDSELAVVCVNTARSLVFKGGRINHDQVRRVRHSLTSAAPTAFKLLVAHHPLDLPDGNLAALAGRASFAMAELNGVGLDMILSGHLHIPYFSETAERLRVGGHSAVLVQAGTAVSTRTRGEGNTFNAIQTSRGQVWVTKCCWSPQTGGFEACDAAHYVRDLTGWRRSSS